ncbi:MAG: PPOX class probable F420-dependent enzyme [Candidatus Azotimanducaceae bacterium]|jgi:PPOX class probable F420-dependent enzyme
MPSFDPATTSYVCLETYRKTGVGVATPVWVATLDTRHYVFSESRAGKVKRLRNNPRVKIAACNFSGNVSSEWLAGQVRIVTEPALVRRVYAEFIKKYGWQIRLTNVLSRLSGRYHQRAMLEISLDADT